MYRRILILVLACGAALPAWAQDLSNIQIHGFATQSFLYSGGNNNYLGVDTKQGTFDWTEGAINIVDQPSDKLRIGIQVHYTRLGIFGDEAPDVDWAMGDYRAYRWLGIRAGKVKIRWGLYNDTQDADPGYLWSLLPESIYSIDDRASTLSELGVEFYGDVPVAKKWGTVVYSLHLGEYNFSTSDGLAEGYTEAGIIFASTPSGKTPGVDLRWKTPLKGLLVGSSTERIDAKGTLTNGIFRIPPYWSTTGYAQYDAHKILLAYQYARSIAHQDIELTGQPPALSVSDSRTWFVMAGYHVNDKLQVGTYYSSELDAAAHDNRNPANFGHDWTISGRYDFNSYLYGKLEGHFINGDVAGLYGFDNLNGVKARTRLVVAKIGFVF